MNLAPERRLLVLVLLTAALAGLLVTGCGSDDSSESPAPDYAKKLAGSPPPLAALHDQSDELLPGGLDAFNARIGELKGFPAVVNVWASWCGPCRAEFPHLQQVSANMGKEIAFLGVNSEDDSDAAETFLSTHPVPYPSYEDPDKDIATALEATHGYPATAFFNADGELTYTKSGPYTSNAELEADIKEHAINGEAD